jgi:hypothetical protein
MLVRYLTGHGYFRLRAGTAAARHSGDLHPATNSRPTTWCSLRPTVSPTGLRTTSDRPDGLGLRPSSRPAAAILRHTAAIGWTTPVSILPATSATIRPATTHPTDGCLRTATTAARPIFISHVRPAARLRSPWSSTGGLRTAATWTADGGRRICPGGAGSAGVHAVTAAAADGLCAASRNSSTAAGLRTSATIPAARIWRIQAVTCCSTWVRAPNKSRRSDAPGAV